MDMGPTPTQVGAASPCRYSDDQLHAHVCIVCGRTDGLTPAEHLPAPDQVSLMMAPWALATTDAGIRWDAMRIPITSGVSLHHRLSADSDTLDALGPIVISARSGATYWLITTGTQHDAWPVACRLLTRGSALVLPSYRIDPYNAAWLHQPDTPGRLTGAVWLAAALNDHLALETQL